MKKSRIISQFDEVGNLVQLHLSLFTAGRRNAPVARIGIKSQQSLEKMKNRWNEFGKRNGKC